MPIAGPLLGAQIFAKFTSRGFTGAQALILANAVGNGIATNFLATNFYQGTTIGTGPGPGVGTGKVIGLVGPIVGINIFQQMTLRGFTGAQTLNTAMAIGEAFAEHISGLAFVTATGAPTAIGSGTGPVLGIVGPLMGSTIFSFMSASGLIGSQALNTAMAIGSGIAISMATALGQTTIVGVPSPPPVGPYPIGGVEVGKVV